MRDGPPRRAPHRVTLAGISQAAWEQLSDFQQRVYRATRAIPRGQTRSYQWVARRIGQPRAARAVGQALHVNPLAPHIPCHRVLCADGRLGGFAGGLRKKRSLLRAEGAWPPAKTA
jgi:methylated-DNA-[protein]-cysteine S-methyltransferase